MFKVNFIFFFEIFDIFPDGEERKKLHSTGIFPDHKLLSEYDIPENYNSFTVIRDPIERAVSFYGWFTYTKYNNFTEFCKDIRNYKLNNWYGMMTRKQFDFIFDKNGNEITRTKLPTELTDCKCEMCND